MNVFELTRALVDIESITNNEERVGLYLYDYLAPLAAQYGGEIETIEVEPRRFNIFVQFGAPLVVTLSTHIDTVPPFVTSREDDTCIWGRGACDTKGIIASMIKAVEALLAGKAASPLFVVGEERNSAGLTKPLKTRAVPYIINGEPPKTTSRSAARARCAEVCAAGKMAPRYPELGDSAVNKLLDALADIRRIPLPVDPLLGPSTLNIGTPAGGRAPNVIADEARADIMIRLVGDSTDTKAALFRAAEGRAELREVIEIPAVRLGAVSGIPTTVVAYTTDIPAFGGAWGEPFLIGPGTIHVAHTLEERVPKSQLLEAVELYQQIVKDLCKREST